MGGRLLLFTADLSSKKSKGRAYTCYALLELDGPNIALSTLAHLYCLAVTDGNCLPLTAYWLLVMPSPLGRKQSALCDAVQNVAGRKRDPVSQRRERCHQGLHRDRLCDGEGN